jgi:hypothetical protein
LICMIFVIPISTIAIMYINYIDKQNEKKKQKLTKITNVAEKIKKIYNINSTEKTTHLIKLTIKRPQYFNVNELSETIKTNKTNDTNKMSEFYKLNREKKITDSSGDTKIINSYFANKKMFEEIFYYKNKVVINDIESLGIFLNDNLANNKNYNLLLKFESNEKKNHDKFNFDLGFGLDFNTNSNNLYIYANGKELIKIVNWSEYEKIYNLIDSNDKIFLIENDVTNEYYIIHGDIIRIKQTPKQIKKIFFNGNESNKNFELISKFDTMNILFFICTKI